MAIGKYSAVPPPPEFPPPSHVQAGAPVAAPVAVAPPILPTVPQHAHSASGTIDIEAWTASALESLNISPESRGTSGTPLAIPLDDNHHHARSAAARGVTIALGEAQAIGAGIIPPRRPPSRRDSMARREALLKGKEGSRQRRRWDMGQPYPSLKCLDALSGRSREEGQEEKEKDLWLANLLSSPIAQHD